MLICRDRQYRKIAHFNVTHRRRQAFYALPSAEWNLLASPPFSFLDTLDDVDHAIDVNAEIAARILETALESLGLEREPVAGVLEWRGSATPSDLDKARSTIRQLYRDWSLEGAGERSASYTPVLQCLSDVFAHVLDKGGIRVLVPGAGLGRLTFDLSTDGYSVEGNELSFHQLIASNWILNHTEVAEQYSLYPFAYDFCNVVSRADQLKEVKIPDVHPATALALSNVSSSKDAFERMNITAADFSEYYSEAKNKDKFDAVVTVFFLDTAPNVIRYIQTVHNCLKLGGIWINAGPLLWHWGDRNPAASDGNVDGHSHGGGTGNYNTGHIELSLDEVLTLVGSLGFEIDDKGIEDAGTGYIQNPNSMLRNCYRTSRWIARKRH